MEIWAIIVSIFGGINVIITALSLLYAGGKKPFIKAKSHKEEHKDLKEKVDSFKKYTCNADEEHKKIVEDLNRKLKELEESFNKKLEVAIQESVKELNNILILNEKRMALLDTTISRALKNNELDLYVLIKNDSTIFDALLARGMNGPIKLRKAEMEAHFLNRIYRHDEEEED